MNNNLDWIKSERVAALGIEMSFAPEKMYTLCCDLLINNDDTTREKGCPLHGKWW